MVKRFLIFIIVVTSISNTFSEALQKRVVRRGTENVVTSISMKTDESIGICLQALITTSEQNKWIDMDGAWNIRTRLDSPVSSNSSCIDIFSNKPVDDTIFIKNFEDSSVIAFPLLIRYADTLHLSTLSY
jgi:hypothetical protein